MKHTPGPWEIVTDSYGRAFIRHPLDAEHREQGYFAQVRDYTASKEKTMANARLIAAAPLMYEALANLIEFAKEDGWQNWTPWRQTLLRDAIAALDAAGGEQ